jgi:putative intracellular protease/amidase
LGPLFFIYKVNKYYQYKLVNSFIPGGAGCRFVYGKNNNKEWLDTAIWGCAEPEAVVCYGGLIFFRLNQLLNVLW